MASFPPVTPATAATLPLDVALAYADRFLSRRDTYTVQQADGRYLRVMAPLDRTALYAHLTGERTVALYALDRQRNARWLCFDSDASEGLLHLLVIQQALAALGLSTLREASRRGGHLWLLCTQPVPAALLRGLALGALAQLTARGDLPDAVAHRVEVYPSADHLGGAGVSQAVRLPFGVHQRSGVVYPFIDLGARPAHGLTVIDGLRWLLRQPQAPPSLVRAAAHDLDRQLEGALDAVALALGRQREAVGADVPPAPPAPMASVDPPLGETTDSGGRAHRASVIAWVNANVDLRDLIAEMTPAVQLHPMGQGWGGWCPFHDDAASQADGSPGAPSLYVVQNWRYGWSWRCYSTECGAHRSLMQHAFDWLVWLAGGDVQRALTWARTRSALPIHVEL